MTVAELLQRLGRAYSLFNANALETWAPVFRARLGAFEGPALQAAFTDTLATFKPKSVAPFPVPLDFEQHLPARRGKEDSDGPWLDFAGRNRRAADLMSEWSRAQGERAAKGVEQLRWALEHIARQKALAQGWNPACGPLRLTQQELMSGLHRALSQERKRLFGMPPAQIEAWWSQIESIASRWNVRTDPSDWKNGHRQLEAA